MAAEVDYRGVCIVKADASDFIQPYDRSVSRIPEISSVAMTSTVQLPLSDNDVASLGGMSPVTCYLPLWGGIRAAASISRM